MNNFEVIYKCLGYQGGTLWDIQREVNKWLNVELFDFTFTLHDLTDIELNDLIIKIQTYKGSSNDK